MTWVVALWQDAGGGTLLHRAVAGSEDLPEYVTALVEAGMPVNAADTMHDTALHVAARQGHLEVSCLTRGVSVKAAGCCGV